MCTNLSLVLKLKPSLNICLMTIDRDENSVAFLGVSISTERGAFFAYVGVSISTKRAAFVGCSSPTNLRNWKTD
jgi:hypothetical protein